MAEGRTPPPGAVRSGVSTGVFGVVVVIVAVIALVAGMVLGPMLGVFQPPMEREIPETLAIATNTPFPPFEFRDENDNIVGFDIDLITAIMEHMGQDFTIIDFRDFSAELAAVSEGRVDVAASAITMSGTVGAERNMTMDFSDPYYEADQAVLVRVGEDPTSCDPSGCVAADFEGVSIATQSGTTSEFWVLDFVGDEMLTTFPDVTQVLQALQTGAVDVVIIDKPAGEGIAAQQPGVFDLGGTIETNELYAFAVPDGDPLGLLPMINEALEHLIEEGTYAEIEAEWFG